MYSRSRQRSFEAGRDIWPSWRYGPDGQEGIFNKPEDVPFGWVKKKLKQFEGAPEVEKLNKDQLIKDLKAKGIAIDPRWGIAHLKKVLDGDVSPTR